MMGLFIKRDNFVVKLWICQTCGIEKSVKQKLSDKVKLKVKKVKNKPSLATPKALGLQRNT